MALSYTVEKETFNSLEENIQKLYVEKDGKYFLDLDLETMADHVKNDKDKVPLSRLNQEIDKRKLAEKELKTIADSLKADIQEEYQELIPDLPPGKLVVWLRSANAKGLFNPPFKESLDTKRPGDKKPENLDGLSPQQKMAQGYKTK